MQRLINAQDRILESTSLNQKRYLFDSLDFEQQLIAITGQRGTGKTTMLLQKVKENRASGKYLYVSADSLFIYNLKLHEVALNHYENGGEYLYIDEIHKYENWSGEIKHIYDSIPKLNVLFTGSSILDILKGYGDISRRAVPYILHGLSFREYLNFELKLNLPQVDFKTICEGKFNLEIEKPLFHFKNYLEKGYYPFYKEKSFELKMHQVINAIMEVDLVHYLDLKPSTIIKLKKLLQLISASVPFKPNISKLAEKTNISRNLMVEYFNYLERAGLIKQLTSSAKGIQGLAKPEKVYLDNTSLIYTLVGEQNSDIGNVRETFFVSQVSTQKEISIPLKGDFLIEDTIFEIGGQNKKMSNYKDLPKVILAKDDITSAYQNQIPLYQFGFLY
ncbi:MAG: ATP-binding protein [Bacteroidetes bacterium]|nr:MAG: ATP-binding protein [Bacteroidota bacterium]MBL1144112.1 ATP-binding protein [Bacteroidota bacterium]NOG56907.1 ATP-binding protein [Bacteroidota bacterium]